VWIDCVDATEMYNAFNWKRRRSGLVVKLLRILPGKFSGDWRVGLGGELSFGMVHRGAGNSGAVATRSRTDHERRGRPRCERIQCWEIVLETPDV
jgi:hypothetical protein